MVEDPTQTLDADHPVDPADDMALEATSQDRPGTGAARAMSVTDRPAGPRYQIGARIGRGGMGEVLEARDESIGRTIAVKRMLAAEPSERAIDRFFREARIQGRLDHPAIVPVYELGRDHEGRPYFAMKKLAGRTLSSIVGDAQVPRQRLLRAFAEVCLALELAHTRGFVHRDIKPDNIMLGDFGETYVLDWGVAKVVGEADEDAELVGLDSGELQTGTGTVIGTLGYMSPEQRNAERDVDARADVYALGCVLFEILSGERLHPKGAAALFAAEPADRRPSRRAPDREIPPELDAICVDATAPERADRIATARELGERVQQFLDGDRDLATRRTLAQQHFDHATRTFAEGDCRTAIRESGRALALDPQLRGAGELLARIMLEPPEVIPAEVVAAFEAESLDITRRAARTGAIANLAYFLFAPLVLMASTTWPYLVAIYALVIANILLLRHREQPGRLIYWPLVAINVGLVVVIARLFTPFLLAPGLAAVTMIGMIAGPVYERHHVRYLVVLLCAAILVPWAGELVGLLDRSTVIEAGRITLEAPIIGSAWATFALLAASVVALVSAAAFMARGLRRVEGRVRRDSHVRAWQLRQLVT